MNILIVAHYQNDGSPSAIFVHAQAREFVRAGHTVRLIAPIPVGKCDFFGHRISSAVTGADLDGIPYRFIRYLSMSNFGARTGINADCAIAALKCHYSVLMDNFTPDVIHAHTLGFDSAIGAWLKERLHVPLVVTTHGSDTSIPVEQGRAAELKHFCDRADQVVAVSSALADKLRTCGTRTPVSVILNGFQISFLSGKEPKVPLSFIQVGSLQAQKRFDLTIRAFAHFYEKNPEATLTIVGQGPEREKLESLCRELMVEDAVHFTGQLPNAEVLTEMETSQFFCMPSVREGFGIVYLEAMASGCITIGTEGEGIADLIVSGENGFLVPPDDPESIVRVMEWCLTHPNEAAAIAERGRQAARELTWEKNAAQYLNSFESLTGEKERNA